MSRRPSKATPAIVAAQNCGIDFEILSYTHDPAAESYGLEAADALSLDPRQVFKTLLAEVDGHPVCAMVPVTHSLSLKSLAAAHGGKRAQMMEPARAQRLTGYVLGGISPLGQRTASPTYLDESAMDHPRVMVSAGRRGLEIALAPVDLVRLTNAAIAGLSALDR